VTWGVPAAALHPLRISSAERPVSVLLLVLAGDVVEAGHGKVAEKEEGRQ
jgi:hypothetical protein